jgi:hypothetical protein
MRAGNRGVYLAATAVIGLTVAGASLAGTSLSGPPVTINDALPGPGFFDPSVPSPATPYPATLNVAGESVIANDSIAITLDGLSHESPDDVDVLVQGPSGAAVLLMSDAGGERNENAFDRKRRVPGLPVSNVVLSFVGGAQPLPDNGGFPSGLYAPTDYGPTPCQPGGEVADTFPAGGASPPPPAGPYSTSLTAAFPNGTNPNGTWKLWVVDDCISQTGSIARWCVTVNAAPPAACPAAPTGFVVGSFAAKRTGKTGTQAQVTWRTGNETTISGFNLLRVRAGKTVKLNKKVIPSKLLGKASGTTYKYVDKTVKPKLTYVYKLELLEISGRKTIAATANLKAK